MVTPALKARFEALGVPLISLEGGAQMLVDEVLGSDPTQVELVLGGEPRPEALLHEDQEGPRQWHFPIYISPQDQAWMSDHSIQGTPVVPAMLALEWFVRAARAAMPKAHLASCQDLTVLKGIRLEDFSQGARLSITARQVGALGLSMELHDEQGVLRYRAEAQMSATPVHPTARPAELGKLEPWGERRVYGDVLFHGPAFQVIEALEGLGEQGIKGQVHGLESRQWGQPWSTDLAMLDGGLQLAVLWAREKLGGRSLPMKIGAYQASQDAVARGPVSCTVQARPLGKNRVGCDLAFTDAQGQVFAALQGAEIQVMPDGRLRW